MNCENFEMLMADALGNELSPDDRPAFEAHLAACASCRRDFESLSGTVKTMRDLSGPVKVSVRREGSRLVINDSGEAPAARMATVGWQSGALTRYAASVLVAFLGGYAFHATLAPSGAGSSVPIGPPVVEQRPARDQPAGLQGALVEAHIRKPRRPDLAKALIALGGLGR